MKILPMIFKEKERAKAKQKANHQPVCTCTVVWTMNVRYAQKLIAEANTSIGFIAIISSTLCVGIGIHGRAPPLWDVQIVEELLK